MTCIKFGTDGWRAVLDREFNKENVSKVINAAAIYIYKEAGYKKPVIIGYDPRNKADEYALFAAEMLSGFGFKTECADKITATPVIAYSALKKGAYAFMFTASHNPPEYLGIKFIPPYGGPAEDYMIKEITDNLGNAFQPKREASKLIKTSFDEAYIEGIKKLIDFNAIQKSGIKINYDGHHGAAGKLFLRILDENKIEYTALNIERNINFGGFMPDPKEEYLPSLKKLCTETGRIGLSNDGDGDRFGVFDEEGNFIKPADIIAMLSGHLIKNRGYSGKLAKTIGAGSMLDVYAEKCGIKTVETAVGFKHLGRAMRTDDILIAGEESGGLSIKGHIPEKDGILANLLIMEMTAYSGRKLSEIHKEFLSSLGRSFINKRTDLKLNSKEEQDKIIEKASYLKEISGLKIVKINSIDGLKFYLEDKSTVLIRRSGTEPLLRIYFESDTEDKIAKLENSIKKILK